MKKKLLLLLLTVFLLCGCQQTDFALAAFDEAARLTPEEVTEAPTFTMEPGGALPAPRSAIATDQGVFLLNHDNETQLAYLWFDDFASGQLHPVCTKINCTHDSYDCSAYVPKATAFHFDGTWLYYFREDQLWRMAPDGTERKMLTELNDREEGLGTVGQAVYLDHTVYFPFFGAMSDPDTGELLNQEHICSIDLDSGKLTRFPLEFGGGDTATLNLYGIYGDWLILSHTTWARAGITAWPDKYTYFALDTNTYEITVLLECTHSEYFGMNAQVLDSGVLIFTGLDEKYARYPDASGGEISASDDLLDRVYVDLCTKKAWIQHDIPYVSGLTEDIVDGKYFFLQWNDEQGCLEQKLRDLATGEVTDAAGLDPDIHVSSAASGEWYLISLDGKKGRIRKSDYWAGNRSAIVSYPDWVMLS